MIHGYRPRLSDGSRKRWFKGRVGWWIRRGIECGGRMVEDELEVGFGCYVNFRNRSVDGT